MTNRRRIGVLVLEAGGGQHHLAVLGRLGVDAVTVNTPAALADLDGLILPGGKSTTLGERIEAGGLAGPLRAFAAQGRPIWGTCAGLVLLARASGRRQPLLGLMDITVRRNAFGQPLERFAEWLPVPALGWPPFLAVFRAGPAIETAGPEIEILASLPDGTIVAARQGRLLATAFHPELANDPRFHAYFLAMVAEA